MGTNFGQCTALQVLGLQSNQLMILPESFVQLSALQALHLGFNQLNTLPESSPAHSPAGIAVTFEPIACLARELWPARGPAGIAAPV